MSKERIILLTFDVEEFDLPTEYKIPIGEEEQMNIGKAGTHEMKRILDENNISSTLFTTANFAEQNRELVKELSNKHEIASHSFYHSKFENADLRSSRLVLESVTGNKVSGLRMPRFQKVDIESVKAAGYLYDSSINPTYIPGRYNNLSLPRTCYTEKNIIRLPVSVTPLLRLPLFWLSFKNLPYPVYKSLAIRTLKKDGYLSLYFHPWEFADITKWKIPGSLKKDCVGKLSDKLERLIKDLKKEAEFMTVSEFISKGNYIS